MSRYVITCISHGRHEGISGFFQKVGTEDVVFFVKDNEDVFNYTKAGAKKVIASGSLMDSRNAALDHAFRSGKICVQLSDDLVSVTVNDYSGKRTGEERTALQAIDSIIGHFEQAPQKFGGFPPTSNPFFALNRYDVDKFIVGDFILVKPTDLRFDTKIRLKEDYDYLLQHIKHESGAIRYGSHLMGFKHYTNKGGVVGYRNDDLEQETIRYLAKKWPGCIMMNPKRKNEILLKKNLSSVLKNQTLF